MEKTIIAFEIWFMRPLIKNVHFLPKSARPSLFGAA